MRLVDLNEELYSLKQGTFTVTAFFTQLKKLWGKIENFRPINPCVCGIQCMCKVYQEQDFIMRFLKGLTDRYSNVQSQILLMDPLPDINRVFSLVVQQERQLASESMEEPNMLAVGRGPSGSNSGPNAGSQKKFTKGKHSGKGHSNGSKMCSFCGKSGHTVDTCFKKHRFPPNFKKRHGVAANCVSSVNDDEEDQSNDDGMAQLVSGFNLTKE